MKINIDDTVDFANFINTHGKIVLKFGANWCAPCKTYAPLFDQAASQNTQNAVFGTVDIETRPDIASDFKIMSVPTTIFIKDGQIASRINGVISPKDIDSFVKEL